MREIGRVYEIPEGVTKETVADSLRRAGFYVDSINAPYKISIPGEVMPTCGYIGEIGDGIVTTQKSKTLENVLENLRFDVINPPLIGQPRQVSLNEVISQMMDEQDCDAQGACEDRDVLLSEESF